MSNKCPTCSHELPAVTCAKCEESFDGQTLTNQLDPPGWSWVPDPRGPAETLLNGQLVTLPRAVLVCWGCSHGNKIKGGKQQAGEGH